MSRMVQPQSEGDLMARKPSPVTAVTLYQLHGPPSLGRHIRERYRESDDFETREVVVGGRRGILLLGATPAKTPAWVSTLNGWLPTDDLPELTNQNAAACLLLPRRDGTDTWAICFGLGFHLLEAARIVPGMGRSLAIRTADPIHLKSLTHSRLDSRAYVARTSMPGGDDLDAFGIGGVADLVTRMVAPARLPGTTSAEDTSRTHEVRGADSVKLPLANTQSALIRDLDVVEDLLALDPVSELAEIEQLSELKPKDPRLSQLEELLDGALGDASDDRVGLAWPTEAADIAVPIHHLIVEGAPRGHTGDRERPAILETIIGPVRDLPSGHRVRRLRSMRVMAFTDIDDAASSLVPARRWIVAEFEHEGHRYCLHDGRWFEVDQRLTDRISARLTRLFDVQSQLDALPAWSTGDEAEYNQALAETLGGVCLDRQLVRTDQHSRGFEACDVLTREGVLLHVKKVDRSTPASHLFAQAAVSTEALLTDHQARGRLRELVTANGGDPSWVRERPTEVALVMARPRKITPEDFFSFSRVRLARLADEADRLGVPLTVHWVPLEAK
ncbi:TIGR04141 family sporadically distributed protein [Pedococcus aerophilus]|uniref:TIGR04141 family sporadically distributed protein n=1 Tax=Pedococcus aerophilus TaxID=436356 RepID=A0ABP6H5L8_9MICO